MLREDSKVRWNFCNKLPYLSGDKYVIVRLYILRKPFLISVAIYFFKIKAGVEEKKFQTRGRFKKI